MNGIGLGLQGGLVIRRVWMAKGFGNTSGILNGRCWHGCVTVLGSLAEFYMVRPIIMKIEGLKGPLGL